MKGIATMTNKKTTIEGKAEYAPMAAIRKMLLGGCSQSTLERLRRNPEAGFPKPLKLGRAVLFNIEEVRQWTLQHRGNI